MGERDVEIEARIDPQFLQAKRLQRRVSGEEEGLVPGTLLVVTLPALFGWGLMTSL